MASLAARSVLFSAFLSRALAGSNPWIQIPWQSGDGFGPDGPWHGIQLTTDDWLVGPRASSIVVYPYGGSYSWALGKTANSSNNKANDTSQTWYNVLDANDTKAPQAGSGQFFVSPFGAQDWYSFTGGYGNWTLGNGGSEGEFYNAEFEAQASGVNGQNQVSQVANMNITIAFWEGSQGFRMPNNKTWLPPVGIWGLGGTSDQYAARNSSYGTTAELKKSKYINSESFGLTFGSVAPQIDPSLYMGAYDQNRLIGDVGVFGFNPNVGSTHGAFVPQMVLQDTKIGYELGDSPFNFTSKEISIWDHLNLNISEGSTSIASLVGGPNNSVVMYPNTAGSTIKLPRGICEAAASYLPVTFNESLGLFIWNNEDPKFPRIVQSPAYLSFTLLDTNQNNLTVKVPFQLLNLTLEKPIVDEPLQYFPCEPPGQYGSNSFFGRAFFQAVYMAVNYEQNLTFIAQAPGPSRPGINIMEIKSDDKKITAGNTSASAWADSWKDTWKPFNAATNSNQPQTTPTPDSSSDSEHNRTLSLGLGLGIGLPAAALIGVAGLLFWRRRSAMQGKNNGSNNGQTNPLMGAGGAELDPETKKMFYEASGEPSNRVKVAVAEADGSTVVAPPSEMDSEATQRMPPQEMAAGTDAAREMMGDGPKKEQQPIMEMPGDFEWDPNGGGALVRRPTVAARRAESAAAGQDGSQGQKRGNDEPQNSDDGQAVDGAVERTSSLRQPSTAHTNEESSPTHTQVSAFTLGLSSPRPESSVSVMDASRQQGREARPGGSD